MTRRHMLRQLLSDQRGLVVPGAHDGVSASGLGIPGRGFSGLAEVADQARDMAAVSIGLNELIGVSERVALEARDSG